MSIWDKFNKLTKLDFDYEGVIPGQIPEIYANSRNQLDIVIAIQVEGIDGEPLELKKEDLADLIYLCDYVKGEKLDAPWGISNDANEYTRPVGPSDYRVNTVTYSGITYVDKYLSCSESKIIKTFAVGINIPGVGDFNTSKHGTKTPNGPKGGSGSPFKAPKYLTISTLHPIDYDNVNNIVISEGVKKFADLKYVVRNTMEIRFGNQTAHVGASAYSSITIKTRKGYHFKKKDFERTNAKVTNVNIFGINDSADIAGSRTRTHGFNSQSHDGMNYDFTLVFIEPSKCGVSPQSYFTLQKGTSDYYIYYDVGSDDHRHELSPDNSTNGIPKINDEYISLVICNYTIPFLDNEVSNFDQFKKGWFNDPSDGAVKINVLDEYGNSGIVKIALDYDDPDYPKVVINGQLELLN